MRHGSGVIGLMGVVAACGIGFMVGECMAQPSTGTPSGASPAPATALRVATFNVEDVRTEDLSGRGSARVRAIGEVIQRIRPNIILINEIAFDGPGSPGFVEGATPGQNAQRLVDNILSASLVEGLQPVRYRVYMAPSNTGMPSGHDLNADDEVVTSFPTLAGARGDGTPGASSEGGRKYGEDCWGYGEFPGQYAMALLVDERLEIMEGDVRTFRLLPWEYMPNHIMPTDPVSGGPWYDDAERAVMRLSSKSHWDVPVRLPDGQVLHVLCSHPTPPAFDGAEERNVRRNHDEVRFWADYVEDATYIVDDQGRTGGLSTRSQFVILGDLNSDPADRPSGGEGVGNSLRDIVLTSPRVNPGFVPESDVAVQGRDGPIDATDTAMWGKRVDYVIPSAHIEVIRGGIWRHMPVGVARFPSDHFPVWADVAVPSEPRP